MLEVFKFPHHHSGKCTYWITTEVKIEEILPVPEHHRRRFKEESTEKLSLLSQMNKKQPHAVTVVKVKHPSDATVSKTPLS